MAKSKEFFSTEEAARIIGVTTDTIRRWCQGSAWGVGKGSGRHKGRWYIHISALRRWGGIPTVEDEIRDHSVSKKAAKKQPGK